MDSFSIFRNDRLTQLMNETVREALGLNVSYAEQSRDTFKALHSDFMRPVIHMGINGKEASIENGN